MGNTSQFAVNIPKHLSQIYLQEKLHRVTGALIKLLSADKVLKPH